MTALDYLGVGLFILAAISVPIAMLMPRSRAKGKMRLAGSVLLGLGFIWVVPTAFNGVLPVWRAAPFPVAGLVFIWLGIRKYRRDPEGRTPPAQIL